MIHFGLGLGAEEMHNPVDVWEGRASLRRGRRSSQVLKVGSPAFSEILVGIRDTIYCDVVGSLLGVVR